MGEMTNEKYIEELFKQWQAEAIQTHKVLTIHIPFPGARWIELQIYPVAGSPVIGYRDSEGRIWRPGTRSNLHTAVYSETMESEAGGPSEVPQPEERKLDEQTQESRGGDVGPPGRSGQPPLHEPRRGFRIRPPRSKGPLGEKGGKQ